MDTGRRDDQQQRRRRASRVAEAMCCPGWHPQKAARANSAGPVAGAEVKLTVDDVEQLLDLAVHVVAGAEARGGDELDDCRTAAITLADSLEDDLGAAQRRRLALARSEKQLLDRHVPLLRVHA